MTYDPHKHHRRSIRLPGYDYTQPGAYFVTFVAHDRECLFGDVVDGVMRLNAFGEIVREEWFRTAVVRPYVMLDPDEFVVMPNHVHGIIWITGGRGDPVGRPYDPVGRPHDPMGRPHDPVGRPHDNDCDDQRPHGPAAGSVGAIIGQIKSIAAKRIVRDAGGTRVGCNYYEHIIRCETSLNRNIAANPSWWAEDHDYPRHPPAPAGDVGRGDPLGARWATWRTT